MNIASIKNDEIFSENISFQQLQNFIDQYPYFSAAQFFLAKKMKQENHPEFLNQLQKTAVYFSNPYWLHYQLLHQKNIVEEKETESVQESSATVLQENNFIISPEKEIDEEEKNSLEEDIHKVLAADLNEKTNEDFSSKKLADILQQQAEDFKKPVDENAEVPIQPASYHTVDYFASQGIKLDAQLQDKLGKQVLRFTDWLKQMKRINAHPADLGTDEMLENKVPEIASHSNEPKEVITEAMAEVLEKQGKSKQAIQLYEKLSLLHPDKSVYFAARIENLKGL